MKLYLYQVSIQLVVVLQELVSQHLLLETQSLVKWSLVSGSYIPRVEISVLVGSISPKISFRGNFMIKARHISKNVEGTITKRENICCQFCFLSHA